MQLAEALQKLKDAEHDLLLKDKEISLLINHCDTLIQQSNTLKLLNDFDTVLEENKYLYDYIDKLTTTYTESLAEVKKEQDKYIQEQRGIIDKQNDELVDLNFVIYNQNIYKNEEMINPLYLADREEEIEQLKTQLNDKTKELLKLHAIIDEIKTFIANQSPYTQFSYGLTIVENLMILFKEKILCQTDHDLIPLIISPESSPLKPSAKNKKIKKRLSTRS